MPASFLKRAKAILLDFGGTLDSDGLYWFDLFYEILRGQGLALPREEFERIAGLAGRKVFQHQDIKRLGHRQTVLRLMEEIASILPDYRIDPEVATGSFVDMSLPWLRSNLDVVAELARSYRLGVLSNNWGNVEGWCREYGFSPYLEVFVDSGLEGVSKPDVRIFRIALERLGLNGRDVVHVGDRYETDIVGAKKAGLWTVWIKNPTTGQRGNDGMADVIIRSLDDLVDVVHKCVVIENSVGANDDSTASELEEFAM